MREVVDGELDNKEILLSAQYKFALIHLKNPGKARRREWYVGE